MDCLLVSSTLLFEPTISAMMYAKTAWDYASTLSRVQQLHNGALEITDIASDARHGHALVLSPRSACRVPTTCRHMQPGIFLSSSETWLAIAYISWVLRKPIRPFFEAGLSAINMKVPYKRQTRVKSIHTGRNLHAPTLD